MSQTTMPAVVGDAIDRALRPGPRLTGIRRLYLVDLLVGYGLRSEMRRGWWCQRALRLSGPRRSYECEGRDVNGDPELQLRWQDHGYRRVYEVHPALGIATLHAEWKCETRSKHRRHAIACSWRLLRERLHDETGHRELWTPDEAADAARVYARQPKSLAYRALMTLIDNPLVWEERHAA